MTEKRNYVSTSLHNLLAEGMSVDAIARITGLSLKVVQQLHPKAEKQE